MSRTFSWWPWCCWSLWWVGWSCDRVSDSIYEGGPPFERPPTETSSRDVAGVEVLDGEDRARVVAFAIWLNQHPDAKALSEALPKASFHDYLQLAWDDCWRTATLDVTRRHDQLGLYLSEVCARLQEDIRRLDAHAVLADELARLRQHDKEATDLTIDQQVQIGRLREMLPPDRLRAYDDWIEAQQTRVLDDVGQAEADADRDAGQDLEDLPF